MVEEMGDDFTVWSIEYAQSAVNHIAVCARESDGTKGPIITQTVPFGYVDPNSPDGQFAYREDVL